MYLLKTLFMKKMIAKKQKSKPFDYEAGESYALPSDADETINNSYYFSAHGQEGESLYCRLGQRTPYSEVWFFYAKEGRTYTHKTLLHREAVPLTVTRLPEGWQVDFEGSLTADDGTEVAAAFHGVFTSDEPAVDFFSHMPPIRTAKAMAGERWSRDFFREVQKNNQVHYEQYGRLTGTLTLDGVPASLALPCTRDHSYGRRIWDYMNNHLWLMAVNESSQLNFSMVSYPAMSILEVGNLKPRDGAMRYILSAEYDRGAVILGEVPSELSLTLTLDDGRRVAVTAKREHVTEYVFEDGAYRLLEGVGNFTVDGVPYRGIIELGVNGCRERIFNGRAIKDLRV